MIIFQLLFYYIKSYWKYELSEFFTQMHIQWLTFSHNIYVLSFYKKGSEAY